jgi:hypothetical protein
MDFNSNGNGSIKIGPSRISLAFLQQMMDAELDDQFNKIEELEMVRILNKYGKENRERERYLEEMIAKNQERVRHYESLLRDYYETHRNK